MAPKYPNKEEDHAKGGRTAGLRVLRIQMSRIALNYMHSQFWTSNTKCPFNSKRLLSIFNNKVRVKVGVIFGGGKCSCLSLLLEQYLGGHFVTLIVFIKF